MAELTQRVVTLGGVGATRRLGERLAARARVGDVILLGGPLGVGKSALARAFLRACGVLDDIPSPTFTLVQVYETKPPVWHVDLYRLKGPEEARELGLEEAFIGAITLIEWPDRLGDALPADRLHVALDFGAGAAERVANLSGLGGWAARLADLVADA
jgi:tRNA threonylcarbamoyladenosine biosynthesis protein TsaE